jgi:hypothetical protein
MDIMSLVHDREHEAHPRIVKIVKDAVNAEYKQRGVELTDNDTGSLLLFIGASLMMKEDAL